MIIAHDDKRLSWHGHISLEQTAEYSRPWRIPFSQRALFFPALVDKAGTPSGVRLAFRTTSRKVAGQFLPQVAGGWLDLYVDGGFFDQVNLEGREDFSFEGLQEGDKLVELWLPQGMPIALKSVTLEKGAKLEPYEDKRKRWITYGSSITHCIAAASPSFTWPAIVAREREVNLTSLGYGGQCHLDPMVARVIRDTPADYLSICAGINIYGSGSLNVRSFGQALIGTVQTIREKHAETPLLLISPIYGTTRETNLNKAAWTLADYRQAVKETAALLREQGDANVHYVSGLEIFDEPNADMMPDGLHPDADGYKLMGRNFLDIAAPVLFGV